jgi:hypothetical protein
VVDIEVKHDDLILGTRRGIWILDDLTALRGLNEAAQAQPVHLFAPRKAYRIREDGGGFDDNDGPFVPPGAANAPKGMLINYWIKDELSKDDASEWRLEIFNAQGQRIRTLSSTAQKPVVDPEEPVTDEPPEELEEEKKPDPELAREQGVNRIVWDLRHEGITALPEKFGNSSNSQLSSIPITQGPVVLPGRYTLKLHAAGQVYSAEAEVAADPRSPVTPQDLRKNHEFAQQALSAVTRVSANIDTVRAVRTQVAGISKRLESYTVSESIKTTIIAILQRCGDLENRLHNPEAKITYDLLMGKTGGIKLYGQLVGLYGGIQASDYAPNQGQQDQMTENLAELAALEAAVNSLRTTELQRLEKQLAALELPRVLLGAVPVTARNEQIDHLILVVSDLKKGMAEFAERTGVTPVYGGEHPHTFTHNALVALDNGVYLEIIAARPDAVAKPAEAAEMAQFRSYQQLTPLAWVLRSRNSEMTRNKLKSAGFAVSENEPGSRVKPDASLLAWNLFSIEKLDYPFFIEWSVQSRHPSASSPVAGRLRSFKIHTPQHELLRKLDQTLELGLNIESADQADFSFVLDTPRGPVEFASKARN